MKLVLDVDKALWDTYKSYKNVQFYIEKWHTEEWYDDFNSNQNFIIHKKDSGEIDLIPTLNSMDGETLIKVAIDLGVDTPDFIPSIPTFRNEIKAEYPSASATFEKAFKQIEEHPDIAIGLVNSALESIIKEILKDERIEVKPQNGDTLYKLTSAILKQFQLFPNRSMPEEIKIIGSSLLAINQSIEKLRSEKTNLHGKTNEDYVINDPLYAYFIVNSVVTVGLFLNSFYKKNYPPIEIEKEEPEIDLDENDLPF